ncbi:hypothetical protein LSH36_330g08038 [Paralvinella palmiformis]|uniref:Uncharacterized protein n=1 Tax=Paralvinella palmiformis TaxID=53620 RepID=A0AAD9JFT8_9ANNE|nr:hypothetical protein LSH36_330g08038 [Paralvinella palmiformis]
MVATLAQPRCQDYQADISDMEALKLRLTRAVSGDSSSSAVSAKTRGRRSALTGFQFRKSNLAKSLLAAAGAGNASKVRELLEAASTDQPDIEDTDKSVKVACERGHLDVLATLIRFGAAINSLADGQSAPLHIAVRHGYISLMMLLIGNGANVRIQTRFERRSPLHIAAMKGHQEAARVLLEAEARPEPDVVDIYGTTPLHLATGMGHSGVVETLLTWAPTSADVNAYDKEGWTALHLAAQRGDAVMAQLLLNHHAQVDCQNKYGRTPLHWATIERHADVVELLLQNGASPILKDLHDKCSLDYADDAAIRRMLDARPVPVGPGARQNVRSTIGGFMKMAVRQSFISRLSSPIPNDGSWTESIVALKHRTVAASGGRDDLDAIAEETCSRNSSGTAGDDDDDPEEEFSATKGSLFKALFGRSKSSDQKAKFDNDSDLDTQSMSTVLLGGLFDRELSTDSNLSFSEDAASSSVTSRCQSPDNYINDKHHRPPNNNNDDDVNNGCNDILEGAQLAQAQFQTLISKIERHQAAIEAIARSVSANVDKAVTGKRPLSDENVKGMAQMMRKIDDLMFDFREDVDQQAILVKETMKAFLANIEPRLTPHDVLPIGIYHGFFHSLVSYLADRPHGHMFLVQKLSGISEEKRSDMLQVLPSSPSAKLFSCGQAVYFALENTPPCYKHTPLLALLTLIIKCDFEEDATRTILQEFISITNPNFYVRNFHRNVGLEFRFHTDIDPLVFQDCRLSHDNVS